MTVATPRLWHTYTVRTHVVNDADLYINAFRNSLPFCENLAILEPHPHSACFVYLGCNSMSLKPEVRTIEVAIYGKHTIYLQGFHSRHDSNISLRRGPGDGKEDIDVSAGGLGSTQMRDAHHLT